MTMKQPFGVCLFLLAFAVGSVAAEEIIHFTNGTTMPIRSHRVVDGMVHADLGSDSFMAFPEYMVERIEAAGADVYLSPSYNNANVTAGGSRIDAGNSARRTAPQTGSMSVSSRFRSSPNEGRDDAERDGRTPLIGVDRGGTAVTYPARNSRNAKARQLGATGQLLNHSSGVVQGGPSSHVGSQQFGRGNVIGSVTPPQSRRRGNVSVGRVTMRDGTGLQPGAQPADSGNDSQSSGGSEEGGN